MSKATMPTREEIRALECELGLDASVMLRRIADVLAGSVVVPREPVGYGLCRKGNPRIIGFLPAAVAERPATSEEFLQNYEHVALYAAAKGEGNG